MDQLCGILLLTGAYPMYRLWRGTAGTTLRHAAVWAIAAWLLMCGVWLAGSGRELRYLTLCLAASAGVAVLGARRPGVGPWNFVVAGLLAVLCRPYLEGFGVLKLEAVHLVFLGASLAVGVGNYVPTRQGITAAAFGTGCGLEVAELGGLMIISSAMIPLTFAFVPWMALVSRHNTVDAWQSFRDAFGFLWAQRIREQFMCAATNAGLRVKLGWGGLEGEDEERGRELLRSMLRRFDDAA